MKSSWQGNPGQLTCLWSDVGQRVEYNLRWMGEAVRGSYLPSPPDFPRHSPFGELSGSNLTARCAMPNRSMDSIA
jgi:hypothetical protein